MTTTFEAFQKMPGTKVAVSLEMASDHITPVSVMLSLGEAAKGSALFESATDDDPRARFSHIGLDALAECRLSATKESFNELRRFYKAHRVGVTHPLSGFLGGIAGYIAYDAIRAVESIPARHKNIDEVPDFCFKAFKTNISFDHQNKRVVLSTIADDKTEQGFNAATKYLAQLQHRIQASNPPALSLSADHLDPFAKVEMDLDDGAYAERVEKIKSHIIAGDIFQAVLSRSFKRKIHSTPFEIYRALRLLSPAPYQFFFDADIFSLVGASPEKLVSLEKGVLKTVPIAGTRRLADSADENTRLSNELLSDEKELAEHVMLVDLARNDLGKVAQSGSVQVKAFKTVKQFSHVMHIISEVQAKLDDRYDAFDVIAAMLPAGTLSGAPKIRAMEIIDELEVSRRGAYGGAVCFIDAEGDLNSCITIRTAMIKDQVATVRAGGGIVYDSVPKNEAEETRQKAYAVLKAIAVAEES